MTETLQAKLRNQLGPAYSLASMVLLLENSTDEMKNKLMPIIINTAKMATNNESRIDLLLNLIDSGVKDIDNYCSKNGHVKNENKCCLICKIEL